MTKHLSKYLGIGILLEILVLILSYFEANGDITHFFQATARLSGRVSLLFFSLLFIYATLFPSVEQGSESLKVKYVLAKNFAIIHVIHWFLLATAAKLSKFSIVPIRVAGGALAYLIIVLLPFIIQRMIFKKIPLRTAFNVYLFYVWLIFFITYLTRVLGKASPITGIMPAYYILISLTTALMIFRIGIIIKKRKWQ